MAKQVLNEVPRETIWELETKLLKEIIKICDKHSIQYYMWVGSALGVVKYGGIIPWDTDIDIAVPIDQVAKLFECLEELPSQYYVLNFERGDFVIHPVAAIEGYNWELIHVDIFPLYGISSDRLRQQQDYLRAHLLKVLFIQKFYIRENRDLKSKIKGFILSGITLKGIYRRFVNLLSQVAYNDAEYVVFPNGVYGTQAIVSKDIIGAGRMGTFRGLQVRIPEKIEEYLTQFFGDYTKDPEGIDGGAGEC